METKNSSLVSDMERRWNKLVTEMEEKENQNRQSEEISEVHVMPLGDEWSVTAEGKEKTFEEQSVAEKYGRRLAKENEGALFVHGEDGEIQEMGNFSARSHDAAE